MLESDDENKIIKKLLVITEICFWLQTFCPSNLGGSQEHISLITNSSYPHVHADKQGVAISVTVCFVFVCTVTYFSGEDKASGVLGR